MQAIGMSQYTKGSDAIDRHSKMLDLSQRVEDQSISHSRNITGFPLLSLNGNKAAQPATLAARPKGPPRN
jgi:hypothetical protein